MKSTLVTTSAALLLSGCVAVADLTTNETIPDRERAIIKTLAERIPKTCEIVQVTIQTQEKIEGSNRKAYKKLAEIRRLYLSDGDWFRATAMIDSVWDEFYLNERTGRLICGERSWKKYADSGSIKFYEFGTQPSPRLTLVSGAKQTEAVTPTAIEKFRDSLRPQLSYRSDSEICEHLRFVTEVATRTLRGQSEGEMIKEMLNLKEAPRPGKISSAVQDFGLKLTKASEMLDRLSADKALEKSVALECSQKYPK